MIPSVILPDTVAGQDGAGAAVPVTAGTASVLLVLRISRVLEYENLEVSVAGSPDGTTWRELARFPPQCYCGDYTLRLDLARAADVKYLRAEWKVSRWAASGAPPLFEFSVRAAEAARAGS